MTSRVINRAHDTIRQKARAPLEKERETETGMSGSSFIPPRFSSFFFFFCGIKANKSLPRRILALITDFLALSRHCISRFSRVCMYIIYNASRYFTYIGDSREYSETSRYLSLPHPSISMVQPLDSLGEKMLLSFSQSSVYTGIYGRFVYVREPKSITCGTRHTKRSGRRDATRRHRIVVRVYV